MPNIFGGELVFMPGERAIYKPDKQHDGEPCTVNDLIPGKNNVLEAYRITLDNGVEMYCALAELQHFRALNSSTPPSTNQTPD